MCVCVPPFAGLWPRIFLFFFYWLSVPFRLLSLNVPLVFTVPHNVDPRVVFTSIGSTPKPRILLACHATFFLSCFRLIIFSLFLDCRSAKMGAKSFGRECV